MPFYVKVTAAGQAKLAAAVAAQTPLAITHFAVGDANGAYYDPTGNEAALLHEVWRAPVNRVYTHPNNASWIIVEAIIPATQGGFDVREAGVFAADGTMVAIGKYPLTNKPAPGSGSEKDLYVRLVMQVTDAASVDQTIDPSLVMATQNYVDRKNVREACRVATTANTVLSGLLIIDGVQLAENDRVLVKSQGTSSQNGIYVAKPAAWTRALDADDALEVTDTMIVPVREGSANADTIWMLATNAPITVGTTALTFIKIYPDESQRTLSDASAPTGDTASPTILFGWLANMVKGITGKANWRTPPATTLEAAKAHMDAATPHTGHAPIASPAFTGTPTAPTAAAGNNTLQLATTAFVQAAISALVASSPAALDTLNELADALGNDPNFATTMTNALAGKAPLASPAFTGTPTAPTAAADTSTTQVASTAFVVGQAASVAPVMNGAAAIGTSKRYARQDHVHPTDTSRQTADATLTALSGLVTGADKLPYFTAADTASTTVLTAFMRTLLDDADAATARNTLGAAPLASPTFTGTPAGPTAAVDTSTTQLASTAFVTGQAASVAPLAAGTAAVGTSKRYARQDHVHPSEWSPGDTKFVFYSVPDPGWLECDGDTIGDATSGATGRANADTYDLFVRLWSLAPLQLYTSAGAVVGRGASAAADWAAHRRIALPDMRGNVPRGWDHGRGVDAGRALGSYQADQLLAHNHPVYLTDDDAPDSGGGGGFGVAQNFSTPSIPSANPVLNNTAIGSTGGTENTVKNVAGMFVIKY